MKENFTAEKNGFTIRLAQKEDTENYFTQNFCPLDKEAARMTGCKESFTKEEVEEVLQISLEMRRRVKEQLKKRTGTCF